MEIKCIISNRKELAMVAVSIYNISVRIRNRLLSASLSGTVSREHGFAGE